MIDIRGRRVDTTNIYQLTIYFELIKFGFMTIRRVAADMCVRAVDVVC